MTTAILFAFSLFALVSSITPGPNNVMLLASGVNYGFRRTLPHMLGVTVGFSVMLVMVGFGLAEFFLRAPGFYRVLRWAGALYLLYLAVRIATAGPVTTDTGGANKSRPFGFMAAALFQWVNPKAWVVAVTAFSAYVPAGVSSTWILVFGLLFAMVNIPCISVWVLFGTILKHWLHEPRTARIFNVVMAILLMVSLLPMLDAGAGN
jgi:threonine/homoserine/homoserine lactone efflux protein